MKWWKQKRREPPAAVVQVRRGEGHPFGVLDRYVPLHTREIALYRAIREGVPIVDAAIWKLTRLCGGVSVQCSDRKAQAGLEEFFRTVDTGWGQRGIQSFLDRYLDDLFTCGHALGEIVLTPDGKDVAALLCADPEQVEARIGDSPLDFRLCRAGLGEDRELPWQDLLLFTPFQPTGDAPCGVSLLRSMPFMAGILLKIFQATGQNWERAGNLRFAVVCRPGEGEEAFAQERCSQIAQEWSAAMQAGREGSVRDFVAVGDVEIKVIGADSPILDSEVPIRQILEQLVARTGIPPFMLGLSWSSTERMSAQQADLLTSEVTAIRRAVEPALCRVAELWLRLHGFGEKAEIVWEDINLQDIVEEAKAELYRAQAEKIEEGTGMKIMKEAVGGEGAALEAGDLELIGALARRPLAQEEIYTFSVRLCDNEIDRDFERFAPQTLEELAPMFVGKSGIFDHQWSARGQAARIYKTEVVWEPERLTRAGDSYCWLKGYAYMVRTESSKDLIAEIEGGIKKEVSVGCSVEHSICSVCGCDRTVVDCGHEKGQEYGGQLCYATLEGAGDAYEFSFVAVPAQPMAGVVKSARWGGGQTLERLEEEAAIGRKYLENLRGEVVRLAALADRELSGQAMKSMTDKLSPAELEELAKSFSRRVGEKFPVKTQLSYGEKAAVRDEQDSAFMV